MSKSWLEKTAHTGEEVDAEKLIRILLKSRDALKAERDAAKREIAAYRQALEEYSHNSGVAVYLHIDRRVHELLAGKG